MKVAKSSWASSPCSRMLCGFVFIILLGLPPGASAAGPTVNWEALRSYAALAVKLTVTATGILVFMAAFVRAALASLRKHVSGSVAAASAQRELFEAIEGPILWLIVLAIAAWLPDILVSIGLLPQGTPFAVNWEEIFRSS